MNRKLQSITARVNHYACSMRLLPHRLPRKLKKQLKRRIIDSLPADWPVREVKRRVRIVWSTEHGWTVTLRDQRKRYRVIKTGAVLDVPTDVQLCPYCSAPLTVSFEHWEQWRGKYWQAGSVVISCTKEPDIDSDQWDDHWSRHSEMPYVYWLPAQLNVQRWVNRRFVFEMD